MGRIVKNFANYIVQHFAKEIEQKGTWEAGLKGMVSGWSRPPCPSLTISIIFKSLCVPGNIDSVPMGGFLF